MFDSEKCKGSERKRSGECRGVASIDGKGRTWKKCEKTSPLKGGVERGLYMGEVLQGHY